MLDKILIVIFLLIIFIPNIGLFQRTDENKIKANLNRDAYKFPEIKISELGLTNFPAIEKWYADKIDFINYLSYVWSNLNYIFGISTKPGQAIIGKNNWLFLGNDYAATIDQYSGINLPSDEEMFLMVKSFTQMSNIAKQNNVPFLVVVAPDKQDIYSELLPDYIKVRSNKTRLDLLDKMLPLAHVDFIDLRNTEILTKKSFSQSLGEIYLAGDSHWNYLGAYGAYVCISKYLANRFNLRFLNSHQIIFRANKVNNTDLTSFLQIKKLYSNSPLPDTSFLNMDMLGKSIDGKERKVSPFEKNENDVLVKAPYENINMKLKGKDNLLLISDSFSNYLAFYFYNDFYDTIRIHNSNLNYSLSELIKTYKPKVIIFQIVERSLINYSNSFNPFLQRVNSIKNVVNTDTTNIYIESLNEDDNNINIGGWGYLPNKDALNSNIYLRLSSATETFDFLLNSNFRPDVKQKFHDGANLGLTGFFGKIRKPDIPRGEYKASIIIINGKDRVKKDFDKKYQL